MLQIILNQPGQFHSQNVSSPQAKPGEALVRIHRIGVCGTDLHAFKGRQPFFSYPRVLGHELGVEVLEVPENDKGIRPGDLCAVEPYLYCGSCSACRAKKTNCCKSLEVLGVHTDGGMCQTISVPVHLLHKSDKLTLDQLALVETLGIGAHAVKRASLTKAIEVLVVGAGPIGLAVSQFAQAAGARVIVLELNPTRRDFVTSLGIETLADPHGLMSEVVIDATGSKTAMEASFQYVDHGGRLVLVGIVQDDITFHDPLFHRREMTVLSSRNSANAFPEIIQMIESKEIDTSPWITHRFQLFEVPDLFPTLYEQANLIKAMIDVSSEN